MNANQSHSSESGSRDRTAKRSWKEKRGATPWRREPESGAATTGDARLKPTRPTLLERLRTPEPRNQTAPAGAVAAVCAEPHLIGDLVTALDDEDSLVRGRAADIIEKTTRRHAEWLTPYREALLARVVASADSDTVMCRLILLIPRIRPTGNELARVTTSLFTRLDGPGRNVQVCAMQALHELSNGRSRLRGRVRQALERKLTDGSPAVKARARRLLTEARSTSTRRRSRT